MPFGLNHYNNDTAKFKVKQFFALCYAIIQLFMAPVMFFMSLINAVVIAVIALNALGTLLGNLIGRELEKAGVLKGKKKHADK